jgi:hypothetical protein
LQLAALPVVWSIVQALPSLQSAEHEAAGSHVSPGSRTPLPQLGEQSKSVFALQPAGQQPSPEAHVVTTVCPHAALQFAALPVVWSIVQALPSLQSAEHEAAGSHVSPGSRTPLPQLGEQSESVFALQPAGQQPSPEAQVVTTVCPHATSQVAALPVIWSIVHALPSLQSPGQESGRSQVSPSSTTPLPQLGKQSESLLALQPTRQHPSPPSQILMAVWLHATLQVAALPVTWSIVHTLASSHSVRQESGGSQVSPGSTTPLPQLGGQSMSLLLLHPAGQQPSPEAQSTTGVCPQATLQFAAPPVI